MQNKIEKTGYGGGSSGSDDCNLADIGSEWNYKHSIASGTIKIMGDFCYRFMFGKTMAQFKH
jgi:hypothetical protein